MDYQTENRGLLDNNQYWNFTTNKLIVILPADNPKNITSLQDLVQPHTKIVVAAVDRTRRKIHQHNPNQDTKDLGQQIRSNLQRTTMGTLSRQNHEQHSLL